MDNLFEYFLDYYTRLKQFRDENQFQLEFVKLAKIDRELEETKNKLRAVAYS